MTEHVFQVAVGKKKIRVVAGLRWIALSAIDGSTPKGELAEAARLDGAQNFGVWVQTVEGRALGAALSKAAPAAAKTAVSAAAWLAQAVSEPTLLLQPLAGKWWVVAVEPGGQIELGTDRLLDEEQVVETVLRRLEEIVINGQATRIAIGGDSYPSIPGLEAIPWVEAEAPRREAPRGPYRVPMDFGALLAFEQSTSAPRTARMQQVSGISRTTVLLLAAMVAVAVVGLGGFLVMKKQKEAAELALMQEELAQQQLQQEQLATLRGARIAEAVARELAVDTATVPPSPFVAACADVLRRVGGGAAGWGIRSIECEGGAPTAKVNWELLGTSSGQIGVNETLRRFAEGLGLTVVFYPANNAAEMSIPLPGFAARQPMRAVELPSMQAFLQRFGTRLQIFGQAVDSSGGQISEPQERAITYLDPENENDPSAANRFKPVPPGQGYRTGDIEVVARSRWELDALALDAPYVRAKRVDVTVRGAEDNYRVSMAYVVGNN